MRIRFHTDIDGTPHIYQHNVSEEEAIEAITRPIERIAGRDESFILIGRTRSGRVLKVIYALARDGDGIFVITAFDLPDKQVRALNRRNKRRGK